VILTLTSVPAFATYGSHCRQGSAPKVRGSYTQGSKRIKTQGSKRMKMGSSQGKRW